METELTTTQQPAPIQQKLVDVTVKDQNDALQLLVKFLALAQKRGAFMIDESAKIYECIKRFE
jgi:hypothetical protein